MEQFTRTMVLTGKGASEARDTSEREALEASPEGERSVEQARLRAQKSGRT